MNQLTPFTPISRNTLHVFLLHCRNNGGRFIFWKKCIKFFNKKLYYKRRLTTIQAYITLRQNWYCIQTWVRMFSIKEKKAVFGFIFTMQSNDESNPTIISIYKKQNYTFHLLHAFLLKAIMTFLRSVFGPSSCSPNLGNLNHILKLRLTL